MAAMASQSYFRFWLSWLTHLGGWNIPASQISQDAGTSVHTWDITTSGFWKQSSSAMLEFYFRFWFSRLYHHRHVILLLPTKFRPNRKSRDRVMTSYPVFKMAASVS